MKSRGSLIFMILMIWQPLTALGEDLETTLVTPPWYHCLGLHKVTQTHLNLYSGFKEKFNDPQGIFCTKLAAKDDPATDYDDDELTVFGLNSGAGHILYNTGLLSLKISDGAARTFGNLSSPFDLTGDSSGNIFVSDTGNDRVLRYRYIDDELKPADVITEYSGLPLDHPMGVSLSGKLLYVADTGNDRIALYRIGEIVEEFAGPLPETSGLIEPTALSVVSHRDRWYYYDDFFIAVIDSAGQRLWKIPFEGNRLVFRYNSIVGKGGFNHLDIDYYGNIYVTDKASGIIHKFDRNLRYIVAIGCRDGGILFNEPRGITINKRYGQVFVSERSGAQYFWIGTDLIRLRSKGILYEEETGEYSVNVSFVLTEHSLISLYLQDVENGEEFTILDDYLFPPGSHNKDILGKFSESPDLLGKKVRVLATAIPTYSSADRCNPTKTTPLITVRIKENTN